MTPQFRQSGFTLAEFSIVMGIGTLLLAATFTFLNRMQSSENTLSGMGMVSQIREYIRQNVSCQANYDHAPNNCAASTSKNIILFNKHGDNIQSFGNNHYQIQALCGSTYGPDQIKLEYRVNGGAWKDLYGMGTNLHCKEFMDSMIVNTMNVVIGGGGVGDFNESNEEQDDDSPGAGLQVTGCLPIQSQSCDDHCAGLGAGWVCRGTNSVGIDADATNRRGSATAACNASSTVGLLCNSMMATTFTKCRCVLGP